MARIIFPKTFTEQRTLLELIKAKHDADGASSVLTPYLLQKGIWLNDDTTAGNTAATHDAEQKQYMRDAEDEVEQRNLKFDPVFVHIRAEVQFLKSFYSPNVHQLGEWGVTVDNQNRINYPTDFLSRVVLVRAIKATHDSYGTTAEMLTEDGEEMLNENGEVMLNEGASAAAVSPLTAYLVEHGIDFNADAAAVTEAETAHANHLADSRNAEEATQQRDNLWNPVVKHLKNISNYLKKLYNDSEKKLGEWGITVDDSPQAPKERISTVLPAGQTTTTGIVIGSTFTNMGTVELHVYKGGVATGTPDIVPAGEMLGMLKGYSFITVLNPSTLISGKYRTFVHE